MKNIPYIFWIRSNKGTDSQGIVRIDGSLKKSGIESELEYWCSSFGAWNHSDNIVQYGYAKATQDNLKKLRNYNKMRQLKGTQIDALIKKTTTAKDYDTWLKKNKKKLAFPFK